MTDFGYVYVVDNNTLSFLRREHRASDFFTTHCRIPSEVLREAQSFPDIERLAELEYPETPSVLSLVVEVMASLPVGDTKFVDLYANLGNADPLIIATALDGQRRDADTLFCPTWTVVSNDGAVQDRAREFGLAVLTNNEFVTRLKDAQ